MMRRRGFRIRLRVTGPATGQGKDPCRAQGYLFGTATAGVWA